ncbi:MAG TPA: methyltransferase domain-containing protein [Ktedonobacterales bacterium]|jgi:trans-aconitate methyltransferase|nr:methyltransferase domain-containing protein [Ktedonobacterales bacterium]
MASSDGESQAWSEQDSAQFIELGRIYTPTRDEMQRTILDLIPAASDERFLAVELGVGAGWLSAALLERFPAAHVLGLDGSPEMLRESEARLRPFTGRFDLRPFRLEESPAWQGDIGQWTDATGGDGVRCVVSSLVVHHLDAEGKRALYRDLHALLTPGGAVLIADLVAPRSEWERRSLARQWDEAVERQALAYTGSREPYQRFLDDHWNWYRYPDPMDMPSSIPEHITWLAEAGFTGVNVFWERAGHAIYGGYKPS